MCSKDYTSWHQALCLFRYDRQQRRMKKHGAQVVGSLDGIFKKANSRVVRGGKGEKETDPYM